MNQVARFAFVFAAVAFAYGGYLLITAEPLPADMAAVATPNHDPHHSKHIENVAAPAGIAAWNPVLLRAEPEAAAPSAPAFVAADTMLYARANARLRAEPNTASGVVTKLAANAPLRAIARSADGAWWQVSLAAATDHHGRTGYVHRDAVTRYPVVAKTKPATAPVAAAAFQPAPAPTRRSQGPLGAVDEAMTWLVDMAAPFGGSAPKVIRTEH
jgi:hypothetical protein